MVVYNIAAWQKQGLADKALQLLAENKLKRLDQDAINSICAGKIQYLDNSWNNIGYQAHCLEQDGSYAKRIIHYAGSTKPWHSFEVGGADRWWRYAQRTEIHDRLLAEALSYYNQAELALMGEPLTYRLFGIPLCSMRASPWNKKYYFGAMRHRHIAETRFDRRTGYKAFYLFEIKIFSRNARN